MNKPSILIATYESLPELYWDEQPLVEHLAARSIDASPAVWTDKAVDWKQADLVLIRSCWDAHLDPQRFLSWLQSVEQVTTVVNDPDAIRWCYRKTYLKDLEAKAINIVPTRWIIQGDRDNLDIADILDETSWRHALVKPSISADGYKTMRVDVDDPISMECARRLIAELLQDRDVLVQPYLSDFDKNQKYH